MKTVLLSGGSFNPIHEGHVAAAQLVFDALNQNGGCTVDEIWFLVSGQNPLKPFEGMAPFKDRLRMVEYAVEDIPYMHASGFEGQLKPPFYTYMVWQDLCKAYPTYRFIWMMGSDNLANFHLWDYGEELLYSVPVIVVVRDGSQDAVNTAPIMTRFGQYVKPLEAPVDTFPDVRIIEPKTPIEGCATDIRQAIQDGKKAPNLSLKVRHYIDAQGLYV